MKITKKRSQNESKVVTEIFCKKKQHRSNQYKNMPEVYKPINKLYNYIYNLYNL